MRPISFVADSASEAVAKIRAELGPEAVVLNVRQLPVQGLSRLWQRPRIEVLAYRPEKAGQPEGELPVSETLAELRSELAEIKRQVSEEPRLARGESSFSQNRFPGGFPGPSEADRAFLESIASEARSRSVEPYGGGSRLSTVLETTGLLPLHAQRVVDEMQLHAGGTGARSFAEELTRARTVLAAGWRAPLPVADCAVQPHVMIGAPGTGKTTMLCKWLTQSVLVQNQSARVWRLDGATANAGEALSVYCEILGVPHERCWNDTATLDCGAQISFIDLPGVNWRDARAVAELGAHLKMFGRPRVHLVLNAAYETPVLLAQVRAFGALPIDDLIVTHLDEEPRWGKIWNLVLGTNYPVRFLSEGQNVPGNFLNASPQAIFARQFPV